MAKEHEKNWKGVELVVEYLQELRVRDGNNIRIINNHIFKEKRMTDEELEAKKIEFSKRMRDIYSQEKNNLEILENIITEVR